MIGLECSRSFFDFCTPMWFPAGDSNVFFDFDWHSGEHETYIRFLSITLFLVYWLFHYFIVVLVVTVAIVWTVSTSWHSSWSGHRWGSQWRELRVFFPSQIQDGRHHRKPLKCSSVSTDTWGVVVQIQIFPNHCSGDEFHLRLLFRSVHLHQNQKEML